MKQLHCSICREPARVAAVTPLPDSTVEVSLECLTCTDHIGATVILPNEVLNDYELPEIGSNIYNPLKHEFKKRDGQ